jgi:hypothetical protein
VTTAHRHVSRTCWAGAVALTVAACGPPPRPQTVEDLQPASLGAPAVSALVVGCWAMSWDLESGVGVTGPELTPDSVLLRGGAVFGSRERILSPATHPEGRTPRAGSRLPWEVRFRVNRWWTDGDTVVMSFSDGEKQEWRVSLDYSEGGLAGRAEYSDMAGHENVLASVRGARIPCAVG